MNDPGPAVSIWGEPYWCVGGAPLKLEPPAADTANGSPRGRGDHTGIPGRG
jgi:hypothetical protein